MDISVAMATYNGERFVQEQLESLRRQTKQPFELIVCDDASKDHTIQVVEAFRKDAPFPVRIYRNGTRIGFPENFLQAAHLCGGDLIAFCDQDDVWLENKLERCHDAFASTDVQLVFHSSQVVDQNLRSTYVRCPDIKRTHSSPPLGADPWFFPLLGNASVFAARLLAVADSKKRPPSPSLHGSRMAHDEWIYFLGNVTSGIHFLSDCLILYRQHHQATTEPLGQLSRAEAYRKTLTNSIQTQSNGCSKLANLAREYAAVLEELARTTDEATLRHRFHSASHYYREIAQMWESRRALYDQDARSLQRFAMLVSLVRSKSYRGREQGGLGVKSLLKDAFYTFSGL